MKPIVIFCLLSLPLLVCAQKKSELQYEIYQLKKEIRVKDDTIASLRKQRAANTTRLESADFELTQLRSDNAALLQRLNKFTSESVAQTENIARGLETLRAKEKELLALRETLGANDSITIQTLTTMTQLIGQNPNLRVVNGSVQFKLNPAMFGLSDSIATNGRILKLNQILAQHPDMTMEIYLPRKSSTGDDTFGVAGYADRLRAYYSNRQDLAGRVRFLYTDAVYGPFTVRLQPDYTAFYLRLRESLK